MYFTLINLDNVRNYSEVHFELRKIIRYQWNLVITNLDITKNLVITMGYVMTIGLVLTETYHNIQISLYSRQKPELD